MDEAFYNEMLCVVTYDAVRNAMNGESFSMVAAGWDQLAAIAEAVDQGIDAHLEACFVPDRGDEYEPVGRVGGRQARKMKCVISVESMPTLLRRLFEDGGDASIGVASSIMSSLGFNDAGEHVGREALGLE